MGGDFVIVNQVPCKLKRADVSVGAGATGLIVGSVSGYKIRVLGGLLAISANGTFAFDGGSTDSTAGVAMIINTGSGATMPFLAGGFYETLASETLIGTATTGSVTGIINYCEVA